MYVAEKPLATVQDYIVMSMPNRIILAAREALTADHRGGDLVTRAETFAAVLAEHRLARTWWCACGWKSEAAKFLRPGTYESVLAEHATHVAAALDAALTQEGDRGEAVRAPRRHWCRCSLAARNLDRANPDCLLHGSSDDARLYQDGLADADRPTP